MVADPSDGPESPGIIGANPSGHSQKNLHLTAFQYTGPVPYYVSIAFLHVYSCMIPWSTLLVDEIDTLRSPKVQPPMIL